MTLRALLYRALSLSNDARAVSRGPTAVGKRLVRKAAYRATTRGMRSIGL
jgi:hypothetical protein